MTKFDARSRRIAIEGVFVVAMPARWHSYWEGRLSLAAVLSALAVARPVARAQSVNGSMTVSATILLAPVAPATRLLAFSVESDGKSARLETTAPVAGAVSFIVMRTVSSSANGFLPVAQAPLRVHAATHRQNSPALAPSSRNPRAAPLRYEVDLGGTSGPPPGSGSRSVTVRIHYVIVPGT
jgi:hypothetical protein